MQGMLLVDKPAGWTSFDVVNYVRRMVATAEGKRPKSVKVGHTGTLDPFATGLLILLIGKDYTKRAGEFSKLDKTYEVTMRLGAISTTGDPEGKITPVSDRKPSLQDIQTALEQFKGEIEQIPPAFSAIKVNGQRAYKLARAGKEVIIEPRKVTINSLELTDYSYPEVKLTANVTSGTYIRTLVEDLGEDLGTGAYTSHLERVTVGDFALKDAAQTKELTAELLKSLLT
ncbi:tRNA pseudouridine(55) synthase TruB [Candidatus Saccharibacteria bacterium CG_4_10_14_0_2_um_filter_52_9]|nr:MAG: tRNA pseudouridine(55) synthase TruB [Candidatus Saccharibacteria bacterium CG_4_10_14_0_2_um_filter_52_9]